MAQNYKNLLSSLKITERVTLKNRMIKAPQSCMYWNEDYSINDRVIDFYEGIAKGGAGMIILDGVLWFPAHPGGIYGALYDDKYLPGMKELVERIHQHDCPIICQFHNTAQSAPSSFDGSPPVAPSTLTEDELPCPVPVVMPTRGISLEEIQWHRTEYVKAALRAQEAGFDGVEVHGAHGYFLEGFLSRVWNKRTDQYGCQNMENRTRLMVEIITDIKEKAGADYLVGVRINGEEWGAEGGMTIEESVEIAKILEAAGADYISVSGYGYGPLPFRYLPDYWPYPEPEDYMKPFMDRYKGQGLFIPSAAAIKNAVKVPVIAAGRMDENKAEEIIAQKKADIIAFGRQIWADPEFPNKVTEGRIEDIVRCTRCGTCEDPPAGPRRCRVNPSMGRERELAFKPAVQKKKVMVVGGGPAGMEAARVAALRGHEVSLYEKESSLGGKLYLASMIKGNDIEDVMPIVDYLKTQIEKSDISVSLKKEVTRDLLAREKPDALIIAPGGNYNLPDIAGIEGKNVSSVNSLYKMVRPFLKSLGPKALNTLTHLFLPVGRKVVIIGGQIEGCQGAVFMAKRGRDVTILESSDEFGKGIPPRYLDRLKDWFIKKNIQIFTGVEYHEINKRGVLITTKEGLTLSVEGDSVMVLPSQEPNNTLAESARAMVDEVHVIGSAQGAEAGSLIVDALLSGRTIGCKI